MIDIKNLRKIGSRLMREIPCLVEKFRGSAPLGQGASGDLTFPIDKKAEDIIFEEVEKLNEPLTVVSEEYGMKDINGGGPRLLIDPIDGSKNALTGLPLFSTSLALVEGKALGQTSIGYVINLVNGDEFWAERGKGSFINETRLKTQEDDKLRVILYEAQNPHADIQNILPLLSLFRRTRCLGSIAIDMALLARGAASMFITPTPSRSFDYAAGYLLVKEAGGMITDLDGKSIDDSSTGMERTVPLLASGNEQLHAQSLEVLKRR
jgi:myo-inositol-1(or 4)-monophosphatase